MFSGERSPIQDYLPRYLNNFSNISPIASINLTFSFGAAMQLNDTNGHFHVAGIQTYSDLTIAMVDTQVLRSLCEFPISMVKMLTIKWYTNTTCPEASRPGDYLTLVLMTNLHTLMLNNYINPSLIVALNPNHNTSKKVLCPKSEELILDVQMCNEYCMDELLEMVKEQASMHAVLLVIVIISQQELIPMEKKISRFVRHVSHVEYRFR